MSIEAVVQSIKKSDKIAIIAHIMPDGDTLGSCLALNNSLRDMGKRVDLYCQDSIPSNYDFLKGIGHFKKEEGDKVLYDLAIAVDCSDLERMGTCARIFDKCNLTVNIDHHVSNTYFGEINYIDIKAAATGEIVFLIISELSSSIKRDSAEALYTAICTDSGSFTFSSTTSRTYRIAADLLDCGIDVNEITTRLFKSHSYERTMLLARALNSLTLYEENKVAIISITYEDILETEAKDSDSESMVNFAKDIIGIELGILLKETPQGTTKASFRSKDKIDVSKLAGFFGGGGHKRAAGAHIRIDTTEAKHKIIEVVHQLFKE